MYQTALLLLTGPLRYVIESITQYLKCANKTNVKFLYVKLEPEFNQPVSKSDPRNLLGLSSFIPIIYSKASSVCENLDVRVLLNGKKQINSNDKFSKFDLILTNSDEDDCSITRYIDICFEQNCCKIVKLDDKQFTALNVECQNSLPKFQTYKTVCLGGTFDRLHNGHKVLLSEAALRATDKLIVGVTDRPMLKRKILWELIEPVEKRIEEVSKFLCDVDCSLSYEIVPIVDPYGPTITTPDIDCIVVSAETKTGGEKVNQERRKRGMSELSMYIVDLVQNANRNPEEEEKMSSSTNRMHLLGKPLLKSQIIPNSNTSYIILLKGQLMSGKSYIAKCFQQFGVFLVCCNDVIHSVLNEDKDLKEKITKHFDDKLTRDDGSFDYEKLTLECLENKEKREWIAHTISNKVNYIIEQKLQVHLRTGRCIVLLKQSTLLELKLKTAVDEIWTTILPVPETVKRLKEFYNISEDVATNILKSVPSNEELIQESNIIFCNLWSTDYTQQQVQRAWCYIKGMLGKL
ncbi:bifunctional coenzyme A synthase-like [Stegodyphus dumicola]|uniref:bifunctional coenzyme A synthase-like n=1 Tax=Stegodyphus dumicola TaxID=202533 RepID=UPI0015A90ED4|nr:bifunctional coenzyme A synthase-like [Stegodyphus dumicola]